MSKNLLTSGIKTFGTVNPSSSSSASRILIGVLDTGSSNLNAVMRSLSKSGFEADLIPLGGAPRQYDCVILPGVGNFGFVMGKLVESGTASWLRKVHDSGTPILGICLGAQLLFQSSEEAPGVSGLGFIGGSVRMMESNNLFRVPHMGWNTVSLKKPKIFGLTENEIRSYYFAHSFYFTPCNESDVLASTQHNNLFCAIAGNNRCLAIQFHPEKSGRAGQEILRRSVEWLCRVDSQKESSQPFF